MHLVQPVFVQLGPDDFARVGFVNAQAGVFVHGLTHSGELANTATMSWIIPLS